MAAEHGPLRIVIVNDFAAPRGGASVLALAAARLMREVGHEVTVLAGDEGKNVELAALGVEVVGLGQAPLLERGRLGAMTGGIRNAAAKGMVARFIAERDDPGTVYHVHSWAQILSPAVFEALRPVAARTVFHAHDMFLACPNGVFMNYRRQEVCALTPLSAGCAVTNCDKRAYAHKLWRLMRHKALMRALDWPGQWGAVAALHPDMVARLVRGGVPRHLIRVIRNPAEPYSRARIPAEENSGVVYVGRLEEDKGALDLARAAQRSGVAAIFVGEGPLRPRLEAEFPRFPVTGWLPREEIGRVAAGARALVMPSHHPEPFAMVIPEATQSGLPVVVARTALMAREVEEAGLGLAFDVFDPGDFDTALQRIHAMSAEEVGAMSRRGHEGAVALALTEAEWAAALERLYRELLAAATSESTTAPAA